MALHSFPDKHVYLGFALCLPFLLASFFLQKGNSSGFQPRKTASFRDMLLSPFFVFFGGVSSCCDPCYYGPSCCCIVWPHSSNYNCLCLLCLVYLFFFLMIASLGFSILAELSWYLCFLFSSSSSSVG